MAVLPEGLEERIDDIREQMASLCLPTSSIYNWDKTGWFTSKYLVALFCRTLILLQVLKSKNYE
jgi:hypothetical protein